MHLCERMAWYVLSEIVPNSIPDTVQGRLPALGWNSWNAFRCDIDSSKIMTVANEIINLGLKDLGYEYVNSLSPRMPRWSSADYTIS